MTHPTPIPPTTTAAPWPTDQPRAGELLLLFAELQEQRDEHAERCHARALDPNPCVRLWELDARLRAIWTELELRDADDLAALYGLRS